MTDSIDQWARVRWREMTGDHFGWSPKAIQLLNEAYQKGRDDKPEPREPRRIYLPADIAAEWKVYRPDCIEFVEVIHD